MSALHDLACPLCDRTAQAKVLSISRQHFLCASCGEFVATHLAEVWLRQASTETRSQIRKMIAEAREDKLLVIARDTLKPEQSVSYTAELQQRADALQG